MRETKVIFSFWVVTLCLSCHSQSNAVNSVKDDTSKETDICYEGSWLGFKKDSMNSYYYCSDDSTSIEANENFVLYHTPIEDSKDKIDHIRKVDSFTYLYLDKSESSFYRIQIVDKEKGIVAWKLNGFDAEYYINKTQQKSVRKVECKKRNPILALNDISGKYVYKVEAFEFKNEKEKKYPLSASITVIEKSDTFKKQQIYFEPDDWSLFQDLPSTSASYLDSRDRINEGIEHFHDFIIADFNFDGLEDFAYLWASGGNGGPLYSYYFQNTKGIFDFDDKFPLQNGVFPKRIDKLNRTLMASGPVGCCKINTTFYQLQGSEWKLISTEVIDMK